MKQPNTSSLPVAKAGIAIRSTVFFLGQVLSTLVVALLMFIVSRRPFSTRYACAKLWLGFNRWTLENICGIRYEVQGLENIPKQNGVVMAKHQSTWETFNLQAIFPPLVFILKQELLRIPIWGWGMGLLDPIAIDRSAKTAALKQILREGEARLKDGLWVVLFPEGTRVPPGQRGQYNASGAMLAHRVGCPLVPVAHNAGEFWRRKAFLKFPGVVQVRIGPAIDAKQLGAAEASRQAEEWIEAQMAEISPIGPAGQA